MAIIDEIEEEQNMLMAENDAMARLAAQVAKDNKAMERELAERNADPEQAYSTRQKFKADAGYVEGVYGQVQEVPAMAFSSKEFVRASDLYQAAKASPQRTTESLLTERGSTHGDFTMHARITQETKQLWHATPNWHKLTVEQKETLHMIAHKVGRILAGDPNHKDHWDDIAGYATLVSQRI